MRNPVGVDTASASPTGLSPLASILVIVGIALSISGWVDVALFYYPLRFGDAEWEFGIISQTFDALPLPLVGATLLALAARSGSRRGLTRALAVCCALVALACLVLLVIFVLDIPVALQALRRAVSAAAAQGGQVNPVASSGLKRAMAKAILFGLNHFVAWGALAFLLWRGTRSQPG